MHLRYYHDKPQAFSFVSYQAEVINQLNGDDSIGEFMLCGIERPRRW